MNDNTPQPDLTAYALGELDHANDAAVHAWLVEHPEARLEVEAISDLSHVLQASAVMPDMKLRSDQRQTILSGPQRVRQMVAAASRSSQRARPPMIVSAIQATLKFAAVAAVTVGAFVAGRHFDSAENTLIVESKKADSTAPATSPKEDSLPVPSVVIARQEPPKVPVFATPKVEVAPASTPVVESKTVVVASTPIPEPRTMVVSEKKSPAVEKPAVRTPEPIMRIASGPMLSTTQQASSMFTVRPAETRPIAEVGNGLAAPVKTTVASTAPERDRAPALLLHSWRAEIATSPWDASRKLVRVSLQLPGEQSAAAATHAYGLQVTFLPNHVRSFRPLCQRAMPAAERDGAATITAWYEVVLNGAATDVARTIGQVTLSNTRFTTAAMSPFDGTKLQLVDRGEAWEKAADDFVFESAVVGFGLLLNGRTTSEGLNLEVVLNLAERAQKTADRHGDRAKFVRLVKDARKAAGVAAVKS